VRVFDSEGDASLSSVLCGIDWVTAHARRIRVANMSIGFGGFDDGNCGHHPGNDDPLHIAICESVKAGVTYTVSAGNDGADAANTLPAAYPEVITVSALADFDGLRGGLAGTSTRPECFGETDDTFAFFSNFGPAVDIAAPGVCIPSTFPGAQYAYDSGTSMAAPYVAGAASLYLLRHPRASPRQVRTSLIARGEPGPIPDDPDQYPEPILNVRGL
jgi:subtilisin